MIRIERDPAWWSEIAAHPALEGLVMGLTPAEIGRAALRPTLLPLASENGGFFFGRMDGPGLVLELHTLFRPAGWGREAAAAGREALTWVFREAQVVVTHEVAANPLSRPPRSFGFALAGDWRETNLGALRAWVLTKAGWEASPAGRRFQTRSLTCP